MSNDLDSTPEGVTNTDLAVGGDQSPAAVARERKRAALLEQARRPNTESARGWAFAHFWTWAAAANQADEPYWPVSVGMMRDFVTDALTGVSGSVAQIMEEAGFAKAVTGYKLSTVRQRVSLLSKMHREAGVEDQDNPCLHSSVRELLNAASDSPRHRQTKKAALFAEDLQALVRVDTGNRTADLRDRALLLVGQAAGGRRRSEIVGIEVEHLRFEHDRQGRLYAITIAFPEVKNQRRSEDVFTVAIKDIAMKALVGWLNHSEIQEGPVFRRVYASGSIGDEELSDRAIWDIIHRRAVAAEVDPDRLSPHSLRHGFVSMCGRANIPPADGMAMSGHQDARVYNSYYDEGAAMDNPAANLLGDLGITLDDES